MSLAAENAAEALEAGASGLPDAVIRLHRIMAQADRAKAIVTQLRAFSRVDATALEAMDLGAAVRGFKKGISDEEESAKETKDAKAAAPVADDSKKA